MANTDTNKPTKTPRTRVTTSITPLRAYALSLHQEGLITERQCRNVYKDEEFSLALWGNENYNKEKFVKQIKQIWTF